MHPALEMLLSADAGSKQVPKMPPPPVPGLCLLVMHQYQVVPDMFFRGPRITKWAARKSASLSLCVSQTSVTSQVSPSPDVLPHPWETITAGCAKYFPRFFLQQPVTRVKSRQEEDSYWRGLVPNKWLFQACPRCSAVRSFLLFAFTVVPLSLWLPRVITSTDKKTLLGTNTIINLLRFWFWSIWKMNSADFQRIIFYYHIFMILYNAAIRTKESELWTYLRRHYV